MEGLIKFLASCEFASPLYFWIASALVLLSILFPLPRRRKGLAIDLPYWKTRLAFGRKRVWVLSLLVAITSLLMAAALANPQCVTKESVSIYGKPVMAVIDVSGSMEYKATGGNLSNFEKARGVFNDLLTCDSEADFGLLLSSSENYIARYFAYKKELLKDTLENNEEIYSISTGTQIAAAMSKAHRLLSENIKAKDKAIVLISDLETDLEGLAELSEEMDRALHAGIKLYVIIITTEEQTAFDGGPRWPQMRGVKMVEMNDKNGIHQVCKEIAAMESSPIREEEILSRKTLAPFLIPPILGLIILCLTLSETYFRKIP